MKSVVSGTSFWSYGTKGNLTFICVFFFRIFARTMQVLGDFRRKATMTIHCSNLHHWRLGSYHFLFPIRRGRTAGAQFLFITHTHPFLYLFSIFCFKEVVRLQLETSFYLELSWDNSSCRGAHAMIGIGRGSLRHSNSYQYLKGRKSYEGN